MRLQLLHDIASFAAQLALAAGRNLQMRSSSCISRKSSSSSSSSFSDFLLDAAPQLAAPKLQDSPEFLALMLLVLHGQLTAAEAGLFATPFWRIVQSVSTAAGGSGALFK
jgi:hypothetical protein